MEPLFRVWVPELPPSSNKIYTKHPMGKGRILSPRARRFKIRAMQAIQEGARVALMKLEQNVPYRLHLAIFFEQVENKTSSVGARYKKMDLTNRVKLIEDTVSEAVGVDDSHNFIAIQEKHCDPDHPGLYVTLSRVPEEEVGLTKEAYDRKIQLQRPQPDRAGGTSTLSRLLGRSSRSRTNHPHRPDRR
jgi:Holliday junction resolvase RusA-like endonuclease